MKKQKKSLSEQLGSIKGTFAASTNGSKVLGEKATFKNNKSDTINQPLKNQSAYPCKDITSDFLLLCYRNRSGRPEVIQAPEFEHVDFMSNADGTSWKEFKQKRVA